MFQLGLFEVIQADREREVAAAIRRRQLLRPQDGPTESVAVPVHSAAKGRTLAVRVRSTGG
jgi:hypothetical protein